MSSRGLLKALMENNSVQKAEKPEAYAKLAREGLLLGHPVKIKGHDKRSDNNIPYHSSIKFFNKENDKPEQAHETASKLDMETPNPKEIGIEPSKIKSREGDDIYAIKLHGPHAEKLKEHHKKFSHLGHKENYEYHPHISVPKAVHDEIKAKGYKTAHEAGIEFGPAELRHGPKTLHTYHSKMDKAEPLLKPWSSQAQAAWGHSPEGKEALGGESAVKEWDRATKGKHLPKHVVKTEELEKGAVKNLAIAGAMGLASMHGANAAGKDLHNFVNGLGQKLSQQGVKVKSNFRPVVPKGSHGTGNYTVSVGPYNINGNYYSTGAGSQHKMSSNVDPKASPEEVKKFKGAHDFLKQKLNNEGTSLLERSEELEKGAVKNALTAGMMAGALASAAPSEAKAPLHEPLHPTTSASINSGGYSRDKMLNAISQVESSGGKNVHHKPTKTQGTAWGKYALMPSVIQDTIRLNPNIKKQHEKALRLQGDNLAHYMQDNPKLEQEIASGHLNRLEHHFGHNPSAIAYAWNQGITNTNRNLKAKHDINAHPYVQKFKHYYESGK